VAIFGRLDDLRDQFSINKALNAAFDYLEQSIIFGTKTNVRIRSMDFDQYEKIEITNDIFAIEQSYNTRQLEGSLFESHIKYIDFQFIVSGEEIIEVVHTDLLEVNSEYNEEGDYSLYKTGPNSSKIIMQRGDLSIFFPKDGHMPGIQRGEIPEKVLKVVVKIPCHLFTC